MSVPVGPPQPAPFPAPAPPPRASALPLEPSEYQQLFRGPRRRWWRPLISLLLTAVFFTVAGFVLTVGFLVYAVLSGQDLNAMLEGLTAGELGPDAFLYNNLLLIALIPSVLLANRMAHGIKIGYTTSVAGRVRWRWLARCLLTLTPLWVLYLGLGQVFSPATSPRPEQWPAILIIVLLSTPLQCAAEEYAFRGWILQNLGTWIRHPVVAIVIATVRSAVTFAVAHGSFDGYVLADIGLFAVVAVFLTWRTGGLEAAIAMHVVNNVLIFVSIVIFGGWADAFVGPETTGTPVTLGISVIVYAIAVALVLWQARRAKIDRLYRPSEADRQPQPSSSFAGQQLPGQPYGEQAYGGQPYGSQPYGGQGAPASGP